MAEHGAVNPYVPGTGTKPPYLAGRVGEKYEIETALVRILSKPVGPDSSNRAKTLLRRLIGKKAPEKLKRVERVSPPLVLTGPRGVGKTALLGWAKQRAENLGMRYATLTEKLLGGSDAQLGRAVMGQKEYNEAAKEITTSIGLGHAAITGVDVRGQTTHPAAVMGLESIIDMQLSKGPLLLILDEAHSVASGLLKEFCIAVQGFIDETRPLALVMAGTPGLRGTLRNIEATFMERAEIMSLNLLAKEEAREALSVPFADTGVTMENDALEMLVEWTDHYPYFIQQAGRFSWEVAEKSGAGQITMSDAKHALELAEQKRQDFYYGRFKELVDGKHDKYALQMIDLIEKQPERSIGYKRSIVGIQEANEGMEYERALEIQRTLMNLGFIHERNERVEAGIPSLFDYVKNRAEG